MPIGAKTIAPTHTVPSATSSHATVVSPRTNSSAVFHVIIPCSHEHEIDDGGAHEGRSGARHDRARLYRGMADPRSRASDAASNAKGPGVPDRAAADVRDRPPAERQAVS